MILFSTRSARHIAANIALQPGACTIQQFSDEELFVRIDQDVRGKKVWVLAATQAPAENILELFFLLDALGRGGAQINLCITYFGYARQVIAAQGEACTAQVISMLLKNFTLDKLLIVHPHSVLLHDYLSFTAIKDIPFFCKVAENYDAIAAPDKGAAAFAHEIAQRCNKELILLTKVRPGHDEVEITGIDGTVEDKEILLVDDIISTGHTIIKAAGALKNLGAISIGAAATHAIFSPHARQLLENSVLTMVTVTNTIAHHSQGKIKVIDVSQFIHDSITSDINYIA